MPSAMAEEEGEIPDNGLQGLKCFELRAKLLSKLHGPARARDRVRNGDLHMDQNMSLPILSFFNPVNESLRGIQHASELKQFKQPRALRRGTPCRWGPTRPTAGRAGRRVGLPCL
jgi:hypothetical protein